MFKACLNWILICLLLLAWTSPALAEVSYIPWHGNQCPIIIVSGEIRKQDLDDFRRFSRKSKPFYLVALDSIGGHVQTALAMGRIARSDLAIVQVRRDARCLSSCVFILAGGVIRNVEGTVGIHRPFDPEDHRATSGSQKEFYGRLGKEIKTYLREMNVDPELYDHMIRIPPSRVKLLTYDALQKYGLAEDDPYYHAASEVRSAKLLGITTEELARRRAKVAIECGNDDVCQVRILQKGQ